MTDLQYHEGALAGIRVRLGAALAGKESGKVPALLKSARYQRSRIHEVRHGHACSIYLDGRDLAVCPRCDGEQQGSLF